jgi:uncharacterized protein YcnI
MSPVSNDWKRTASERKEREMSRVKRLRTLAIGAIGMTAIVLSTAMPASAHFGVTANTTAAGSYALLNFSTSHGCEGSPTTQVTISIPEGFTLVRPGMNYGWTVEVVRDEAKTVTDSHGNETNPVSEVVYTAKEPLADGFYDSFNVQVQLPDMVGETIYFPVIQTCEVGENAWIQIPAEGDEDGEELESPAPSITITEATESGH